MNIGLTGGIASGKSFVSTYLSEKGLPIIDADKIARQVVEPGTPALEQIVNQFGEKILQTDGHLDRKALGSIVFASEEKRNQLNRIVHPAVREKMLHDAAAYKEEGHDTIIFDIPLLVESHLFHLVDQVWIVYVDEETQLTRLMERDGSTREEALQRIRAQIPLDQKIQYGDQVIKNSGTKQETAQQIDQLLRELQQ
ncbi:dephospho-CoA kinase [Alkalihalobacillus sp. LMS6]|uniref:dephospho-CoA kinase n=1 Tax=Alkalihalobacillus sp. LMS6 TaxID=2924034 RepID=UPI0020D0ECE6|nr:dephospho-CoA kinase [Alkalihalobacillus sp. LMS6]UTR05274.1 dephospho-CoA kinase [Alkalihalobacillus sp. LMS6]